jgi:hypothetical protein
MDRARDLISNKLKHLAANLKKLKKQPILRDKVFIVFGSLSVLVLVIIILVLVINVRPQDFNVPLEYASASGFGRLAPWYYTYIYGLFSFLVTFCNLILSTVCFRKTRISSFFLVFGTVFINILTLVVVIHLINSQQF